MPPAAVPSLTDLCLAGLPAIEPASVWSGWSLSPVFLMPLLLLLSAGAWRLRQAGPWQTTAFVSGWLLLAMALLSPLCRMAASLASAHMVQHVILVALAPPLLLLGLRPVGWFPPALRRPGIVSGLYAAAIWLSHLRPVYEAALTDPVIHVAVTVLLLAAALIFWHALIGTAESGGSLMLAFGALIQTGVLGALLTFAPVPWYPLFDTRALAWGLTPLEDQQLAGLIMWIPMGSLYLAAALIVLARLLTCFERTGPEQTGLERIGIEVDRLERNRRG